MKIGAFFMAVGFTLSGAYGDLIRIRPQKCRVLVNFSNEDNFGISSRPISAFSHNGAHLAIRAYGDERRWVKLSIGDLEQLVTLTREKPRVKEAHRLAWSGTGHVHTDEKPHAACTVGYEERKTKIEIDSVDTNKAVKEWGVVFILTFIEPVEGDKELFKLTKLSSEGELVQLLVRQPKASGMRYQILETCGKGFGYAIDGKTHKARKGEIDLKNAQLEEEHLGAPPKMDPAS